MLKFEVDNIVLQVDVPLVPASQCNAALKRALNQKKPGVGDRFQLSQGEVRWSPNNNSDVDLHPIPKTPKLIHERRCARGQRMGKMLALAMVEALLCARLSREGEDDGNLYHGFMVGGQTIHYFCPSR